MLKLEHLGETHARLIMQERIKVRRHLYCRRAIVTRWLFAALLAAWMTVAVRAGEGRLALSVIDRETQAPVACRMHLKNAAGKPVRPPRVPYWHDHFVFPGSIELTLPRANYTFELERGPEYTVVRGHFTIEDFADDEKTVELARVVDMAAESWWSADLHIHRAPDDIELLMQAEDLHVAPVVTWWNKKNHWAGRRLPTSPLVCFDGNRYYHLMAGEHEREGGALLYFNLPEPLPITQAEREYPSPLEFLTAARHSSGVWVDVEKPFWWDVPVWLASGLVDSVGLANNHMCRSEMHADEAWGRPRDKSRLLDPWGNGLWSQEIYYHLLNCGLRVPPSAGSASGVLPNPVGYNRMYVFVGDDFSYERFWEGFRRGRVVVTNGPLVRPLVAGKLPGHVFAGEEGAPLALDVNLKLSTRDPLNYFEIIKNGQVERSVRLDEWAKHGQLEPLVFEESGWFLIRAVTDVRHTYRFASTGPYYVEIGERPRRISRQSVEFFLDWVGERMGRIDLADNQQRAEVLKHHEMAQQFWRDLLAKANAP